MNGALCVDLMPRCLDLAAAAHCSKTYKYEAHTSQAGEVREGA